MRMGRAHLVQILNSSRQSLLLQTLLVCVSTDGELHFLQTRGWDLHATPDEHL